MAGLGLLPEGHLLVLPGHHATKESLSLLSNTLTPLAVGHAAGVFLLTVLTQAYLPYNALKQFLHIVV